LNHKGNQELNEVSLRAAATKNRRATTDHTDSTDKKTDEDWQIALNPP
jgi:hypothetical protein